MKKHFLCFTKDQNLKNGNYKLFVKNLYILQEKYKEDIDIIKDKKTGK